MPTMQTATKQIGPRSLQRMCLAVALRNIASITDVGELPFAAAEPLLRHVENPAQLHELEVNCPQLAAEPEQMGQIWSRLLHKKFPKWDEKDYPIDDDMSWFEIYTLVKETVDRDTAAATARLQQKLAGFDKAKEGKSMQFVSNRALLKTLPNVRRRGPPGGGSFTFGGGSRTKMTSGQSVLRRARREAIEISKVSALSTPTGSLRVAQGQIRKAPEAMVHDYRIAHNPAVIIRPPKKRQLEPLDLSAGAGSTNEVNEARLMALKTGKAIPLARPTATAAPLVKPAAKSVVKPPVRPMARPIKRPAAQPKASHHHDDDDLFGDGDSSGDDDLFGDAPRKKARLTIEDLESDLGSTSLKSKGRPPPASTAAPRRLKPTTTPSTAAARDRTPQRRSARPSVEADDRNSPTPSRLRSQPSRAAAEPPKPAATARPSEPSPRKPPSRRSPGPGAPARKKAPVDIFFRPKKR